MTWGAKWHYNSALYVRKARHVAFGIMYTDPTWHVITILKRISWQLFKLLVALQQWVRTRRIRTRPSMNLLLLRLPMTTEIWLSIIAALLTLTGTLASIGYRDMARRITHLEEMTTTLNASIVALVLSKNLNSEEVASILLKLLTNNKFNGGD